MADESVGAIFGGPAVNPSSYASSAEDRNPEDAGEQESSLPERQANDEPGPSNALPFYPRRGRGSRGRGNNRWRKPRNAQRWNQHWDPSRSENTREEAPTSSRSTQLAPLSAAKGVIKSRLSVMFRGLRGIEAAQAAFDLCGVEVGFQVSERDDHRRESGAAEQGRAPGRVPRYPQGRRAETNQAPTEPNVDPQA